MGGKKASGHHLASRVKKIMQKDEDVGKIAQATPVLICRAMEMLLKKICEKTFEVATNRQAKTVNASHVKSCVMSEETLDFLKDTVAAAPDLAPEEAQPAKAAAKRRRTAASAAADDSDDQAASPPRDKPKRSRASGGGRPKKEQKQQEEGAQEGDAAAGPPPAKRRGRKKALPDDIKPEAPQADAQEDAAGGTMDRRESLPGDMPADDAGFGAAADDGQQGVEGEMGGVCTDPDHAAAPSTSLASGQDARPEDTGITTTMQTAATSADQAAAELLSAAHSIIPPPASALGLGVAVEDDYDDDYDDDA